jgi:hypothetical protein
MNFFPSTTQAQTKGHPMPAEQTPKKPTATTGFLALLCGPFRATGTRAGGRALITQGTGLSKIKYAKALFLTPLLAGDVYV